MTELAVYDRMCTAIAGTGFVYLIEQVGSPSVVKIGWARNPYKRVSTLRTGSAEQIGLACVIAGTRRDEADLHACFKTSRTRGEWFNDADGHIRQCFRDKESLWLS